jgi:hypothetical protein
MSALAIYKATLENLAQQGNEEAKIALRLAASQPEPVDFSRVTNNVCEELAIAQRALGNALRHNDRSWNRDTDASIEESRRHITRAITVMAMR